MTLISEFLGRGRRLFPVSQPWPLCSSPLAPSVPRHPPSLAAPHQTLMLSSYSARPHSSAALGTKTVTQLCFGLLPLRPPCPRRYDAGANCLLNGRRALSEHFLVGGTQAAPLHVLPRTASCLLPPASPSLQKTTRWEDVLPHQGAPPFCTQPQPGLCIFLPQELPGRTFSFFLNI